MVKLKYKKETSSGGIVYKKEKSQVLWLVTQHSLHKGWSFPKGLIGDIDATEDRETAALREVEEEGGVKAKIIYDTPVEVAYTYRLKDTLVDKNVFYYLMKYVSGDPANHDWEVSEATFLPEEEVRNILTFKTDKEAFDRIVDIYKGLKHR